MLTSNTYSVAYIYKYSLQKIATPVFIYSLLLSKWLNLPQPKLPHQCGTVTHAHSQLRMFVSTSHCLAALGTRGFVVPEQQDSAQLEDQPKFPVLQSQYARAHLLSPTSPLSCSDSITKSHFCGNQTYPTTAKVFFPADGNHAVSPDWVTGKKGIL